MSAASFARDGGSDEAAAVRAWPSRSCKRMRAGLRSALKTDCSGLLFQNGGRTLRWFTERAGPAGDDPGRERIGLLLCGHVRFLQLWREREEGVSISIGMAMHLFFSALQQWQCSWWRGPADAGIVHNILHWIVVDQKQHWQLLRAVLLDALAMAMDTPSEVEDGMITLLALAHRHDWRWFVDALRHHRVPDGHARERSTELLLLAGAIAGDAPVSDLSVMLSQALACGGGDNDGDTNASHAHLGVEATLLGRCVGMRGSVEVLEWFDAALATSLNDGPAHSQTVVQAVVAGACNAGRLDLLESLDCSAVSPAPKLLHDTAFVVSEAVMGEQPQVVQWLDNICPLHRRDRMLKVCASTVLACAIRNGDLASIALLVREHSMSFPEACDVSVCKSSPPTTLAVLKRVYRDSCGEMDMAEPLVAALSARNVRPEVISFLAAAASAEDFCRVLCCEHIDDRARDRVKAAAAAAGKWAGNV